MSPSNNKLTHTPATMEDLIKVIVQLSSFDESKLKEALSSGKLKTGLQIYFDQPTEALNDFVSDEALVDASPLPLSIKQHFELIRASIPSSYKQAGIQEDTSHQNRLDALYALLSAICALVNEENQKEDIRESKTNRNSDPKL